MTFKAGVIGLGRIGLTSDLALDPQKHVYSHARAFDEHPSFELVAGVDADRERRADFSREYGQPVFEDVDIEMHPTTLDVVAIAVPTESHVSVIRKVLCYCQPRVVLCEKPLSSDLRDARQILDLCEQSGVELYVNYIRRVDMAVREIKMRISRGEFLRPVKGVVWYSKGMFNNGSHFFDLLQFWLGEMDSFQIIGKKRNWHKDPEPDILVQFSGTPVYFIAAKEENFSHYTVELIFSNGRLRYDLGGQHVVWQPAVPSTIFQSYTMLDETEEKLKTSLSRVQWHVADQLALVLDGKRSVLCTGAEALRIVEKLTLITE